MDLTQAVALFGNLRKKIADNQTYLSGNETVTRVLLIDPVLEVLGWDVRNPDFVELEYEPAASKRSAADYVLKNRDKNIAIVEAKKLRTNIGHLDHREQADGYARYAGVKFFVLTDGANWLLYERDLMTSLEVLEPTVRFNLENDDLTRCALDALALWRSNLGSDTPFTSRIHPAFYSPSETPDVPKNQPGKSDDDWVSLNRVDFLSSSSHPGRMKIQGKDAKTVNIESWIDVWIFVADWLATTKTYDDWAQIIESLPASAVKVDERTFWGGKAGHQLPNGMWINTGLNVPNIGRYTKALVKQFDIEPTDVLISFNASED